MRAARFESRAPLLPEILALHGQWRPTRPALVSGDERLNWREFCAANHRFAHGLRRCGIDTGDRVGILMSNGAPMAQALFGTMCAGAVSVPLNLTVTDDTAVAMLRDAGVSALVVSAELLDRGERLRAALPDVKLCIVAGHEAPVGWTSIDALTRDCSDSLPDLELPADLPLNIIYSSGTTGVPKGIVHTQRGRRDWAYDLAIALRYHGASRTLLTIGLYSNISWVGMLCTLLAGGTLYVHNGFDADAFLDTVEREGITHTAMVPIQYQRVIEAQTRQARDVSSMQAMMSAGSPLRETLKQQIFRAFPCGIIELYGLTEGIITTLDPEDADGRWASVGRPLIGTDIRIIGDDDRELPAGEAGEIVSRGRITMPGYWQRPDADRDAEYRDEHDRQWLRSGDIGYVDDEGFLYIVDRKKDMILSGGQNVYPQDIEAVLATHGAVDDVAVIGLPSQRWGETPVALVVPRSGIRVDLEELRTWANAQLGKQQRVADVIEVRELPRNPNGKILKRELRRSYGERSYD
jgi:acyl-CoA synthetase (AMP-forming)/AMP-acid ligase II